MPRLAVLALASCGDKTTSPRSRTRRPAWRSRLPRIRWARATWCPSARTARASSVSRKRPTIVAPPRPTTRQNSSAKTETSTRFAAARVVTRPRNSARTASLCAFRREKLRRDDGILRRRHGFYEGKGELTDAHDDGLGRRIQRERQGLRLRQDLFRIQARSGRLSRGLALPDTTEWNALEKFVAGSRSAARSSSLTGPSRPELLEELPHGP